MLNKKIKPRWYKIFACLLIFISVIFAIYGLYADNFLLGEIKNNGWYSLFGKDYIKGLIISPLWVVVSFLLNLSLQKENSLYKNKENQLFGLIKGKTSVDVIDIREIIQDCYDQENELAKLKNGKDKLEKEVVLVTDEELKM